MGIQIRRIQFSSAEYKREVALRDEVLRKPLGLKFSQEQLDAEHSDFHFGAFDDEDLIGCVILTPVDSLIAKLRQMAVADNQQGKGIGRKLVDHLEKFARDEGFSEIQLAARVAVIGFYEALGYKTVGPRFEEVTIPHQKMSKRLD